MYHGSFCIHTDVVELFLENQTIALVSHVYVIVNFLVFCEHELGPKNKISTNPLGLKFVTVLILQTVNA